MTWSPNSGTNQTLKYVVYYVSGRKNGIKNVNRELKMFCKRHTELKKNNKSSKAKKTISKIKCTMDEFFLLE